MNENISWMKSMKKALAITLSAAMMAVSLPQAAFADQQLLAGQQLSTDQDQVSVSEDDIFEGAIETSTEASDEDAASPEAGEESADSDPDAAGDNDSSETAEEADPEDLLNAEGETTSEVVGGNRIYTGTDSDLVATVPGGEEGDVYFAYVGGGSMLIVNTDKNVTISMKSQKTVTEDLIYVTSPANTKEVRHITLNGVSIDRSEKDIVYQGIDLVTGLYPEQRAEMYALYFEGTEVHYGNSVEYAGSLHITLQGENTLVGAKNSNVKDTYSGYTPSKDDVLAGIRAMNLEIDGDGSLNVSGREYGIYVKRDLYIAGGCIQAKKQSTGGREISCSNATITGGCFDKGSGSSVYDYPIYTGTVNNGAARLVELSPNQDASTKEAYPYKVQRTGEASAFLEGMIARSALAQKENGQDFAAAYDMALTNLDAYRAGSSVNLSYGINYGFDMGQSQAIVNALQYDHPEYWWLWIDKTSPGATGATLILKNGYNASKYQSRSEAFEEAVTAVERASGVCDAMTDYQKAYVLYQALAGHVSYDSSYIDQSSGSAFLEKKAVCDGFAKAYMLLLQRQGIPASYVEGWGTPGGSGNADLHGWVIVAINDAYYYCDPTWDCQGNAAVFDNFMKNAADFNGSTHEPFEDNMGYQLPASAKDSLGAPTETITLTLEESSDGAFAIGSLSLMSGSPVRVWISPAEGKSVAAISLGAVQKSATEADDGTFYADFDMVSANAQLTASYKDGSRIFTRLETANRDLSVKTGEELWASFTLRTKAGQPVSHKPITVTLQSAEEGAVSEETYNIETDQYGEATLSIRDLSAGRYLLMAEFAGDENYRPSGLDILATVLETVSYEVGDFILSKTDGGELTEGQDYTYTQEQNDQNEKIDGSGLLTILSQKPVTISMRDDVSVSHDRICNGAMAGFVPKITLNGVIIDRSGIEIEGTAYAGGSYNPTQEDKKLTAAIFSESNSQSATIVIEGYNSLTGAQRSTSDPEHATAYNAAYTNPYYATIDEGSYTFQGSGELHVNAYAANDSASIYGMDVTGLTMESAAIHITANAIAEGITHYPLLVRGIRCGTFTQSGGSLEVTIGDKDFDTDYASDVQAVEANKYTLKAGIFEAAFYHKALTGPIESYHNRYGLNTNTMTCTGGKMQISGFDTGIFSDFGDGVSLSNIRLLIEDCATPLTCRVSGTSTKNPLSIESGLYGEGNAEDNTVYGFLPLSGCTVKEVTVGGRTWYQVVDDRGLMVSGAEEGTDYIYANGEYLLLTETPMVFTMREGKNTTQNRIRAAGEKTYHITLDNVTIDRSAVTYDEVPTYEDDNIIHIENGNLNLTLSGQNTLKGSDKRGRYQSTNSQGQPVEFGSDNTGILVERGKLTVDGEGSLTITEPGSDYYSGGIVAFAYEQKGGSVDITAGKEDSGYYALQAVKKYKYNTADAEPKGAGDILISKGTLKAVVAGGQQTNTDYEYSSGIFAAGNLIIAGGVVTSQMGDTAGSSTGVFVGGDLTVKGGSLTATGQKAGRISAGIQCGGDLTLTGGEIIATGGQSGDNSVGYGIRVNADVIASDGRLIATGGTSPYGDSIALEQIIDTGHVKFSGAEIVLKGADADNSSYGGKFNGHMEISGGSVTAIGGKAKGAISIGIANDTDSEAVISGGDLICKGADAALGSAGLFESSISGGVDLKITGGTIVASGGKVTEPGQSPIAAGIYVYNQLQISGGRIQANGQAKAIDCSTAVIRQGAFAEGDVTAKTVYGMKIASDCTMEKGADADYPYIVKDPKAAGGSGGTNPAGSSGGTNPAGGSGSTNPAGGSGSSQSNLPAAGTSEKSSDGKATYEVTGTTQSGGKTVAEVTYKAPENNQKKVSSVTIPASVTLEDGSKAVVTEIAPKAFSGNRKLTKVVIPATVEVVGSNAFAGCSSLKSVTLKGSGLVSIGKAAFKNCKKLTSVTIGKNVSSIGKEAFAGNTKLKKIYVYSTKLTKKKVGKKAFSNIAKKAVVYYPKGTTKKQLKNLKAVFKKAGAPKTITYKKSKK